MMRWLFYWTMLNIDHKKILEIIKNKKEGKDTMKKEELRCPNCDSEKISTYRVFTKVCKNCGRRWKP